MSAAAIARYRVSSPAVADNRAATYLSIVVSDILAILLAGVTGVLLCHRFHGQFELSQYLPCLPLLSGVVLVFWMMGLYPGVGLNHIEEIRRTLYATSIGYLMLVATTF